MFCCLAAICPPSWVAANESTAEVFRNTKRPSLVKVEAAEPSRELLVHLKDGANGAVLSLVAMHARPIGDSGWWFAEYASPEAAESVRRMLGELPGVLAYPNSRLHVGRDQFVPNDPYFNANSPASGWPGQWHLLNTFVAGRDINVQPAWQRNLTGQGVIVGIIDDGFETSHLDLSSNFTLTNSFDFVGNDTNVSPGSAGDIHGTSLAGIIAGRGGNTRGIAGVAPFALWSGQRVNLDAPVSAQLVSATLHRSTGANVFIRVKNHSYGGMIPWGDTSAEVAAIGTSAAAGTIHVRSAGNLRGSSGEDVNKHLERNTVHSITVGAMGSDGLFSSYSNFGASLMCVAPSSSDNAGTLPLLTTDRTGESVGFNGGGDTFPDADYTSLQGGTSSAAAIVSGVMALARQAQPSLDNRFAKHLIARTSTQVNATDATSSSDGGWKTNGAGLKFNQNYGFGLINADALTLEAIRWAGPSVLSTWSLSPQTVGVSLPDGNTSGLSRTFTVSATGQAEEISVSLQATHAYRGDLEAFLTSPSGMTSRLFVRAGVDDADNLNWTFTTNAFWGESVNGTWTIRMVDAFSGDIGTWNNYAVSMRLGRLERVVSGDVILEDWIPSLAGQNLTLDLEPVGGGTVVSQPITLDAAGNFTFRTALSGQFNLLVKSSHWLRKAVSGLSLDQANVTGVNFSLKNGDVNEDNEVGPADFSLLAAAFGSFLGDPNYSANADLNGDEEVGPADFAILAANFGEFGD